MMPKSNVPKSLQNVDVKALLRKRGVYDKQIANKQLKEVARPLAKKLLTKKASKRYHSFTDEVALEYWNKQVHTIEVVQAKLEQKIRKFISKLVTGYLANLDTELNATKSYRNRHKGFFEEVEDELLTQAQLDFTPLLIDQAVIAGNEALQLIGSKDIYNPYELRKQITDNVTKFTKSMIDTDRQKLIDIIEGGIRDGKTQIEIRNAITETFDEIEKKQAMTIVRTEVARVSNQASIDAWEQSGLVEGKQWITYGPADDEDCQHDGEIVALNENFYGIETEFQDGDPPVHPNCMCGTIAVLIND